MSAGDDDFGDEQETPQFQKLKLDGDDAAVEAVKAEIAKTPNDATLHAKLGKLLIEHDDFDGGVAALDKAIELDPKSAIFYAQKAHFLLESNETEEALKVLNKALTFAPDDAEVHYELGRAYQASGNKQKALENFNAALNKDAKHTKSMSEIAANLLHESDAKMKEKSQEEALKLYKKVIEFEPNNTSAYLNAGQILQSRNKEADIKEAAGYFAKVVSLDQKDGHARARLVQCYDALNLQKEREEAREAFHKAFDAGKLSQAYRKLGRYCCAQFEVGDFYVMGYDHLVHTETNDIKYAFLVYKKGEVSDEKILYRITLTHVNGAFNLDAVYLKETRAYVSFKSAPAYQEVKTDAIKIIKGEIQPTGTTAH